MDNNSDNDHINQLVEIILSSALLLFAFSVEFLVSWNLSVLLVYQLD